jgi:hypothetical protein
MEVLFGKMRRQLVTWRFVVVVVVTKTPNGWDWR